MVWNKGSYNRDLIEKVNQVINSCTMPLTIGQIYAALETTGNGTNYKAFLWHLAKARTSGQVDNSRIAEGRGRKRYKGGGVRNKFALGDKVRINRHNKRTPEWLRQDLRLDTPRTIVSVGNVPREFGFIPKARHTLYGLGNNRIGLTSDNLADYYFRAGELIPYIKGDIGRPKHKRHYNQNHDGGQ